jgi:hypothetical protein
MRMSRSLPAFCACLIALYGASASAQPARPSSPSSETSAMTDKARELYVEGQKSAARERWGEAHASWLAAWGLKHHYQIAGSLGTAEAKLGRYRDAAEHLAFFMREAPATKVKERQSVQELLAEVRKHVGALGIKVEPAGAEVLVDGVRVGKAPLVDEVFVDAGARVIEARLEGYEIASAKVDAAAGASREVALRLVKSTAARVSTSADAASAGSTAGSEATGVPLRPLAQETDGGSRREGTSSEMRPLMIGGLVATGVAVSMGIAFAIVSSVHATDAAEQRSAAVQRGVVQPCAMPTNAKLCEEFTSTLSARDDFGNASLWSFVVGGALGAGTVVYMLTSSKPKPVSATRAIPIAMGRGGGVLITGEW